MELDLNDCQLINLAPDRYIADTSLRYHAYRRLAALGTGSAAELADLENELVDRYGPLPAEAQALFALIGLKQELRAFGIGKLEQAPGSLVFSFVDQAPVDPQRLLALIQEKPTRKKAVPPPARLTPDQRLIVPLAATDDLFARIHCVLRTLQGETP